MKPQSTDFQSL